MWRIVLALKESWGTLKLAHNPPNIIWVQLEKILILYWWWHTGVFSFDTDSALLITFSSLKQWLGFSNETSWNTALPLNTVQSAQVPCPAAAHTACSSSWTPLSLLISYHHASFLITHFQTFSPLALKWQEKMRCVFPYIEILSNTPQCKAIYFCFFWSSIDQLFLEIKCQCN